MNNVSSLPLQQNTAHTRHSLEPWNLKPFVKVLSRNEMQNEIFQETFHKQNLLKLYKSQQINIEPMQHTIDKSIPLTANIQILNVTLMKIKESNRLQEIRSNMKSEEATITRKHTIMFNDI